VGCQRGRGARRDVRGQPGVGSSVDPTPPRNRLDPPRTQTKFRSRVLAGQQERLAALTNARPDAMLTELQEALPTTAALSSLWREIDLLGLTVVSSARQNRTGDATAWLGNPPRAQCRECRGIRRTSELRVHRRAEPPLVVPHPFDSSKIPDAGEVVALRTPSERSRHAAHRPRYTTGNSTHEAPREFPRVPVRDLKPRARSERRCAKDNAGCAAAHRCHRKRRPRPSFAVAD
jgi:hypothetical protein